MKKLNAYHYMINKEIRKEKSQCGQYYVLCVHTLPRGGGGGGKIHLNHNPYVEIVNQYVN